MSDRILLPGSPIDNAVIELPPDQLALKLAAEQRSQIEVLPDEITNARVAQEHASIWQERDPLASPASFPEGSRRA